MTMKAQILSGPRKPFTLQDLPIPEPKSNEVRIKIAACGVCRTDLHIIDKELTPPSFPLILGHQIVGYVDRCGHGVTNYKQGDKVGVAWLGSSCNQCEFCSSERENLCDQAQFTGFHINGGFAEYTTALASFIYPLPSNIEDVHLAPLMCAGLIGYRAYRKTGKPQSIGFYGFGFSAHLLIQLALYEKKKVYAFTRPNDNKGQRFAKKMGAVWSGNSLESPPEKLDAAIIFASAGELIPKALKDIKKGAPIVCAGIHMNDIPSFPYKDLWGEKSIASVANLTRKDGWEFLALAEKIPVQTAVTTYPLEQLNQAVSDLREGKINGSAVIDFSLS
jgi:alcohol dehydrogenase, propanol-preferring